MRHVVRWSILIHVALAATLSAQQQQPSAATQSSIEAADFLAMARLDGDSAGRSVGTSGWGVGSFFVGLVTGPLGAAIMYAVAAGSGAEVGADRRIAAASRGPAYQLAYQTGYEHRVRSKRKRSTLVGGIIGSAITVALFMGMADSASY